MPNSSSWKSMYVAWLCHIPTDLRKKTCLKKVELRKTQHGAQCLSDGNTSIRTEGCCLDQLCCLGRHPHAGVLNRLWASQIRVWLPLFQDCTFAETVRQGKISPGVVQRSQRCALTGHVQRLVAADQTMLPRVRTAIKSIQNHFRAQMVLLHDELRAKHPAIVQTAVWVSAVSGSVDFHTAQPEVDLVVIQEWNGRCWVVHLGFLKEQRRDVLQSR